MVNANASSGGLSIGFHPRPKKSKAPSIIRTDWCERPPTTAVCRRSALVGSHMVFQCQARPFGQDVLLISTPMYNFTLPAVLKSWIDYVVRPGFTFLLAPGKTDRRVA